MENASKALLIAASILIAIILIAFAVKTISSTKGTQDSLDQTMTAAEIAMFNNKFLAYVGENKSPTEVKSLLNLVIANNSTSPYKISINVSYTGNDITKLLLHVTKESYKINIVNDPSTNNDYSNNGCISNIRIEGLTL